MDEEELNGITEKIIGCAFAVSNELGAGFLEKVYENAMVIELHKAGLKVENQKPLTVFYGGVAVGDYYADLFVNDEIVVELKSAKNFADAHMAQVLNYLRACNRKCGLLLNFGKPKVEIKRILNGFVIEGERTC